MDHSVEGELDFLFFFLLLQNARGFTKNASRLGRWSPPGESETSAGAARAQIALTIGISNEERERSEAEEGTSAHARKRGEGGRRWASLSFSFFRDSTSPIDPAV